MYFFKYQPLKERLKNRMISDREALPYLLLFGGLEALVLSMPASSETNKWDVIERILYVIVTMAGILYVYRKNGGSTGYDIIHKFVVLGWVVAVRYFIFVLPVAGLIYFTAYYYGLSGEKTTVFDAVFSIVLSIIYYERLGRHISDTNKQTDGQITFAGSGLQPEPIIYSSQE